jgi:5-oxoprolinase (ATP-hydrolysing) subunit A
VSRNGVKLPARIHTFCVHGDEASGVAVVGAVRSALESGGLRVVPLPEMTF